MIEPVDMDLNKIIEELPWPQKGDKLFKADDDWWNNACINFLFDHLEGYIDGYKRAGDLLVADIQKAQSYQDTLVYPIVFLYRHYLELRLKSLIRDGRELLDEKCSVPETHDLNNLWGECKKILLKVFPDSPTKDLFAVQDCLKQFAEVDPYSESFRYPFNKNGDKTLTGLKHINLRNLNEVMNRIASFLDATNMCISENLDLKREIEAEYRD